MTMRRATRIALALVALATPAAAGTFTPPEGCEGFLTIQQRSCRVSNHYTCAADAPGDQWRVDFGINGAYFASRIDYETQWVESHESDGTVDRLEPGAADPASFSELISTSRDSFDFTTLDSNGLRENIQGYDQLTGVTAMIDGVALERTKFDVTAADGEGNLIWRARGGEYIHRGWRLFLSGAGQVDIGEGWLPQDFTPVEFAFPGDEGFMSTEPKYDCEAMTASYSPTPEGVHQ